jgi:NAD(P)H-dependent FMN reductase
VTRYDGLRHIPPFDPDVQAAGNPTVVADLIGVLTASDALVIACPEYAHSLPGTLKNALDWLVGSYYLDQLPLAVTASVAHESRGRMGLAALAHIAGVLGADVVWERTIVRGPDADHDLGELLGRLATAGLARRDSRAAQEP